jgi:hypothetical protein
LWTSFYSLFYPFFQPIVHRILSVTIVRRIVCYTCFCIFILQLSLGNVVTNDLDCSLCICSSISLTMLLDFNKNMILLGVVSENIGNNPSYSKVSPLSSPSSPNHSPNGIKLDVTAIYLILLL